MQQCAARGLWVLPDMHVLTLTGGIADPLWCAHPAAASARCTMCSPPKQDFWKGGGDLHLSDFRTMPSRYNSSVSEAQWIQAWLNIVNRWAGRLPSPQRGATPLLLFALWATRRRPRLTVLVSGRLTVGDHSSCRYQNQWNLIGCDLRQATLLCDDDVLRRRGAPNLRGGWR